MTDEMVLTLIGKYSGALTCFCFMGGDSDPAELERLAMLIKKNYPEMKIAWYSGRAEVPGDFDISVLNYIKLGPYIEHLGGLKSERTNQRLYRIDNLNKLTRIFIK